MVDFLLCSGFEDDVGFLCAAVHRNSEVGAVSSCRVCRVSTVDFVDVKYPDENYPGCKYLGPENRIVFRKFYVTVEACTL